MKLVGILSLLVLFASISASAEDWVETGKICFTGEGATKNCQDMISSLNLMNSDTVIFRAQCESPSNLVNCYNVYDAKVLRTKILILKK